MDRKDFEYTHDSGGSDLLTGYIEQELRPVNTSEEAEYLSEKCQISEENASDFLRSRDLLYTTCDSDAEFILCNSRFEIENSLVFTSGIELDPDSFLSLLYHSSLYRLDSRQAEEQFRNYFPTVPSLEDMYKTESRSMYDD